MNDVVRAACYGRKSTGHNLDLEVNSIEAQRQFCESFIAAHAGEGWEAVPERYDDAAVSGAKADRPALNRLLADARAGKFQVVVCYKLDRISRNLRDFIEITETLQRCGVRLACVAHPIDTGTAAGRAFIQVMAVFAQLERDQGAERVRDRVRAVRRKGGYIGGATPFGYLARDKHLVPDPERRDAVRLIYEAFRRTGSVKEAGRTVASLGVTRPDGRPWNLPFIERILRNRVYVGEVEFEGSVVKGENEPIVEKDLWEGVQTILRERRSAGARQRPSGEPHPLAGLVRCGTCGSAMSGIMAKGRHHNGKVYWYFSCRKDAKRPDHKCATGRIPGGILEKAVLDRVSEMLRSPEFSRMVADDVDSAPAEVRHEFENVTEFWSGLFPAEKWRLLKTLVESVTVLPDEIAIKVRTKGVALIMEELRNAR